MRQGPEQEGSTSPKFKILSDNNMANNMVIAKN